jgi:hypothetical protein
MTAIARSTDREDTIAAAADFLAKRPVHNIGAAVRFDWTRRSNRGTRETTGSVRRSIEAVTEGLELELQAFTSPPQPVSLQQSQISRGALGGSCSHSTGVITTAAERLHGSSTIADSETLCAEPRRRESRITRFQVSANMAA